MNKEELQEKFEQLASAIDWIKTKLVDLQEDKEEKPFEVKVPEDIGDYYYVDEIGEINLVRDTFHETDYEGVYQRGLIFKTREEAKQFDKERILIKKLEDWAKEHQRDWTPNWKNFDEEKRCIEYDNVNEKFKTYKNYCFRELSKLPCFQNEKLAEQFLKEFGDEIIEVFC